jgi:hypothetical protein
MATKGRDEMSELSKAEKVKIARIFANAEAENVQLRAALKKLVFAARTSGGVAGRDDALCAACDEAESVLS